MRSHLTLSLSLLSNAHVLIRAGFKVTVFKTLRICQEAWLLKRLMLKQIKKERKNRQAVSPHPDCKVVKRLFPTPNANQHAPFATSVLQ